jgi:hypothetical protein
VSDTGTSCIDSSRLRAVTTMASKMGSAEGSVCACAVAEANAPMNTDTALTVVPSAAIRIANIV